MVWHKKLTLGFICFIFFIAFFMFSMSPTWSYVVLTSLFFDGDSFGSLIYGPVVGTAYYFHESLSKTNVYLFSFLLFFSWLQVVVFLIMPRLQGVIYRNKVLLFFYALGSNKYPWIKEFFILLILTLIPYLIFDCFVIELIVSHQEPFIENLLSHTATFSPRGVSRLFGLHWE